MDALPAIRLLGLLAVGVLAVPLVGNALPLVRAAAAAVRKSGWPSRLALAAALLLSAAVLLRPHEDTFIGVDTSALRLMTQALQAGRGFHDTDDALLEVPPDLRRWFLFAPIPRFTRDRAFEVLSLDSCRTQPFLYPLLPLSMLGFDLLVPGEASDYLVPLLGLVLFGLCLLAAFSAARGTGALLASALLLGSPLAQWHLRGCVAESVSAVLLGVSVLRYAARRPGDGALWPAFLGLGLAASYHPLMIAPALGTCLLMIFDAHRNLGEDLRRLAVFGLGVVPILLITLRVCQPYGAISLAAFRGNLVSASYRIAVTFGGILLVLGAALFCSQDLWLAPVRRWLDRPLASGPVLLAASALPALCAMRCWSEGRFVRHGLLAEYLSVLHWPLALLAAVLVLVALFRKGQPFAKMVLVLGFFCLPVFLYLAGKEHVGFWNLRRLVVPWLLTCSALVAPAGPLLAGVVAGRRGARRAVAAAVNVVLLFVLGANAVRWPAAYLVRFERGAGEQVARIRELLGRRLAVFDYVHYSVPLTVSPGQRVLGITDAAFGRGRVFRDEVFRDVDYPRLIEWLRAKARSEEVLLVTAFANPGLEDGLVFQELSRETFALDRIRNKRALPAVRAPSEVDIRICRVLPAESVPGPLEVHKVFDGGYLGLRPSWARGDIPIELPDGTSLPACWSKEDSGIVGPVPDRGAAVQIEITGTAGRADGVTRQVLVIKPPWEGKPLRLEIPDRLATVSGTLARPRRSRGEGRTGIYRIYSEKPYDPASVGIEGFDEDLGARIHSMSIRALVR